MYVDIGRLSQTPELKQTPNGKSVCSFTIAVDDIPAADGTKHTNFIDCVAWGKKAEHICKFFAKGNRIFIQGDVKTRTYTDKEGKKRKATEVLVDNVKFCEGKLSGAKPAEQTEYAVPTETPVYGTQADNSFEEVAPDDDLPF